jgi:hypothetical protein
MVEIKLIAEVVLVVIAGALIIWYVVNNYQSIEVAFNSWFDQLKSLINVPA